MKKGENITVESPLLMRESKGRLIPMTGAFMASMDKVYAPTLGWYKATIHRRRRGFATAAVRCGVHMAQITIAMRHSQGVTLQYVALSLADKATMTTRLSIAAYTKNTTKPRALLEFRKKYLHCNTESPPQY